MRKYLLSILLLTLLFSCGKKTAKPSPAPVETPKLPKTQLTIFARDHIRSSGFEGTMLAEYSKKYNCDITLTLFASMDSLLHALQDPANAGVVDVVMSLDNTFTASEDTRALFVPQPAFSMQSISRDLTVDIQKRLIPYGYANLGIVYNSRVFDRGPESFGELQDARYFRQLAICDPNTSGEGRGLLHWSMALFGSDGYQYMWKSIKKNVSKAYPSYTEALEALTSGKCSMLIGYNSTAAWLEETDPANKLYKHSMMKEGWHPQGLHPQGCGSAFHKLSAGRRSPKNGDLQAGAVPSKLTFHAARQLCQGARKLLCGEPQTHRGCNS